MRSHHPRVLLFHDRLFLQRFERPRCPQCRKRILGPAAKSETDLWLPRLQRRMRPVRAHYQNPHRRGAGPLRQGLLLGLPTQPRPRRERRACTGFRTRCLLKTESGLIRASQGFFTAAVALAPELI